MTPKKLQTYAVPIRVELATTAYVEAQDEEDAREKFDIEHVTLDAVMIAQSSIVDWGAESDGELCE